MRHPGAQVGLFTRTIGHGLGVIGAIFGLEAIATAINPHFVVLFPFDGVGLERDSAAVVSLSMMAVGAWLVWARDYHRRKTLSALSRSEPSEQDEDEGGQ